MKELPLWRMLGLGAGCAFVSGAAGFIACWVTNENVAVSIAATAAVLAVSMYFTMRWWLRACRAAGVDTAVKWTGQRVWYAVALLALLAFGIAANFFAYIRFGDRLFQFTIAFSIAVPAGIAIVNVAPRLQRPKIGANDAKLLLFSFITMLLTIPLMIVNIVFQLHTRDYPDLLAIKNATIASLFFVVPLMPFQVFTIWQQYNRARDAGTTLARS